MQVLNLLKDPSAGPTLRAILDIQPHCWSDDVDLAKVLRAVQNIVKIQRGLSGDDDFVVVDVVGPVDVTLLLAWRALCVQQT